MLKMLNIGDILKSLFCLSPYVVGLLQKQNMDTFI